MPTYTPDAEKLLRLAKAKARSIGNAYLYDQHILIVILTTPELFAHQFLIEHNFDFTAGKTLLEEYLESSNVPVPEGKEIKPSERVQKILKNVEVSGQDNITSMHIMFEVLVEGLNRNIFKFFFKQGIRIEVICEHLT